MIATLPNGRECHHDEFVTLMGFDAFRICRGLAPRNFTARDVSKWIAVMSSVSETDRPSVTPTPSPSPHTD